MASPKQERIMIKRKIIAVLNRDGRARTETLCAQLGLEYGMKDTSIKQIVNMLERANIIEVVNGHVQPVRQSKLETGAQLEPGAGTGEAVAPGLDAQERLGGVDDDGKE